MASTTIASARDYLYNPKGQRRLWAALSDALTNPAIVHDNGDSITHGTGIDGASGALDQALADVKSKAGQFRTLFSNRLGVGGGGLITPQFQGTDSRVTLSGSPTGLTTSGLMRFGRSLTSTQSFQAVTPPCTAFDIRYGRINAVTGSFTYTVDGGAPVTVNPAAPDGLKSIRVTGLSDAPHTIVITGVNATAAYNFGIAYHYNKGVILCRHGQPGWTVNDVLGIALTGGGSNNGSAIGNSAAQARLLDATGAWSPHGIWWEFGHNDCVQQLVEGITPADFGTKIQSFVTTGVVGGASILLQASWLPPTQTAPVGGYDFTAYHAVLKEIAMSNDHCSFLNWNDVMGTAANAVELGLHAPVDSVHGSTRGYGMKARTLFNIFTDDRLLAA